MHSLVREHNREERSRALFSGTQCMKSFGHVFPHIKFNNLYLGLNSSVVVLNGLKLG